MSWWESAYRSGHVMWDPGAYDGHLPGVLERFDVHPCTAIDLGCGTGKSAVWLAGHGFRVTGIDLAPTAIRQAREHAAKHGVDAEFLVGAFPRDFIVDDHAPDARGPRRPHLRHEQRTASRLLPRGGFDLAIERAFVQHLGHGRTLETALASIASILSPAGLFYSLTIAAEGASRNWGISRWSEGEIRAAMEPHFTIVEMRRDVFTPGEPGSIPAWITVMHPK